MRSPSLTSPLHSGVIGATSGAIAGSEWPLCLFCGGLFKPIEYVYEMGLQRRIDASKLKKTLQYFYHYHIVPLRCSGNSSSHQGMTMKQWKYNTICCFRCPNCALSKLWLLSWHVFDVCLCCGMVQDDKLPTCLKSKVNNQCIVPIITNMDAKLGKCLKSSYSN